MLPAEDPIVYCQPPVGIADSPEGHTVFAKTGKRVRSHENDEVLRAYPIFCVKPRKGLQQIGVILLRIV